MNDMIQEKFMVHLRWKYPCTASLRHIPHCTLPTPVSRSGAPDLRYDASPEAGYFVFVGRIIATADTFAVYTIPCLMPDI